MGHVYSVCGNDSGYTGPGDFATVLAASGKPCVLLGIRLNQILRKGDAQAEMLHVQLRRFTTNSSGGTAASVNPHNTGSPAGGVTGRVAPTTDSSTGLQVVAEDSWNVQAGWLYVPTPQELIEIPASAGIAIYGPETPDSTMHITATFVVEEFA